MFSSGYAANVGALSALVGPGETVISDALNHASIIDGCRLSRARTVVVPHSDPGAIERALADTHGVCWVVTESYYGMDGDSPDLRAIRRVCDAAGAALVVDEAHALGVFGSEGRGVAAEQGVVADVIVGGLGKAFGVQGGFVATTRLFRDWLWNRARSFVFSTGVSPLLSGLALYRLHAVRQADAARARLGVLSARLEQRLRAAGIELPAGRRGPIFPVIIGSEADVMEAARRAAALGVICQPIRPPTVPPGSCRLRVSLRATMLEQEVERVAEGLESAWSVRAERRETGGATEGHEPGAQARTRAPAAPRGDAEGWVRGGAGSGVEEPSEGAPREVNGPAGAIALRSDGVSSRAVTARGDLGQGPWARATGVVAGDLGVSGGEEGAATGGRDASNPAVDRADLGVNAGSTAESPIADGQAQLARTESPRPSLGASEREALTARQGAPRTLTGAHSGAPVLVGKTGGAPGVSDPPVQASGAPRAGSPDLAPSPTNSGQAEQSEGQPASQTRWVVLGVGTGVGKTFVAHGLVSLVAGQGRAVAGLKPIETGIAADAADGSDAAALERASFHVKHPRPHPLYGFRDPVTPALAARNEGRAIDLQHIRTWVDATARLNLSACPDIVVETAGGVFSPLGDNLSNLDLAHILGDGTWLLVAADRLGVLHEVISTLHAMATRARLPDWIILSAPAAADASTGTNARELRRLAGMPPIIELARNSIDALGSLLDRRSAAASAPPAR